MFGEIMAADLGDIEAAPFLFPLKDGLEVWFRLPLFELDHKVLWIVLENLPWTSLPGDSIRARLPVVHILDEKVLTINIIPCVVTGCDHGEITSQWSKESHGLRIFPTELLSTDVIRENQSVLWKA